MRSGLELAGRYRLEAPLGRGGMGEVWQGMDLRLRRPVAVKILPLSGAADQTDVARFRREAEIAAALNHPGITTVFDVDEHTDGGLHLLFLVMELMRGRDLAAVMRTDRRGRPEAEVAGWAVQVLSALAAAHKQGVVHRDIKPANLFLTDDGWVKVCDFGISRLADATKITVTGSSTGTPLYMAPEQIEGQPVDGRTDLYAFGCVLYQLLTGTTWIDADASVGAVLHQHLNRAPASPKSVRPEISDGLAGLVLDLLAKQPGDRPADATTVVERLGGLTPVRPEAGEAATPTRPVTFDPPAGGARPAGPPAAGDRSVARTAAALAWLPVAGLLTMCLMFCGILAAGAIAVGPFALNVWLSAGEATALGAGARLLSAGRAAGRRAIVTAGTVAALHAMSGFVQYQRPLHLDSANGLLIVIIAPLTALAAIVAVMTAALPATDRWCRYRPAVTADPDGRTATAAIVLALACLPGLVTMGLAFISFAFLLAGGGSSTVVITMDMVVIVAGAVMLLIGVPRLARHEQAGRRLTAIAAGVTALQAASGIVQFLVALAVPDLQSGTAPLVYFAAPLVAAVAVAALITALLPATRRWCRRADGAPVRPSLERSPNLG